MPKWPAGWVFAQKADWRDFVPGDRVELNISHDKLATCENCGSDAGLMQSFVVKGHGPRKYFGEDSMDYLNGRVELGPCPVCNSHESLNTLIRESGLMDISLEGKPALSLRLGSTNPRLEQQRAFQAARALQAEYNGKPKSNAIFFGQNGAGKTHIVISLLNAARIMGFYVHFTTADQMLQTIKASYDEKGERTADVMDRYLAYDILAIDEFDKVRGTDWEAQTLFDICERRHSLGRPTYYTSNKTPQDLKLVHGYYASIMSRIGSGYMVAVLGSDLRSS